MITRRALIFAALVFSCQTLSAQSIFYYSKLRPSGLNWQELKTPHFRVIFPEGEGSLAYNAGLILEQQYPTASKLTGGKLRNFPVVLSSYNDLSNGFVTSFNFRSEFDLAPFKGKAINPRSGNWMEAVLPHELLHATHANVNNPISIGGVLRLFSPDVARSINFFPSVGVHEGLAVYLESNKVHTDGGRGNYTFFNNQFNSNLSSTSPWSMAQTLQPSSQTLPYNRHYIAGYTFTQWLHDTYGEDISRKSINFHYNFFFMGYGFALKQETKKWPGQLYNEYQKAMKAKEAKRLAIFESISTSDKHIVLPIPFKGLRLQKPLWIGENQIVYFGSQYNAPRGFYTFDLHSKKTKLLKEAITSSDFNIEHDASTNSLLYSEYGARPLYAGAYLLDIHQLDLATGKATAITNNARAYAPTNTASSTFALQTNHSSASIISISKSGEIDILNTFPDATPVAIKANPSNKTQLAIIMNKKGVQALWLTTPSTLTQDLDSSPTLAFNDASIHDLAWHPTEQKLLFTLDKFPAMNIYEFDVSTGDILQLTSSLYNAFEASYSPDGNAIVYTFQHEKEQKIAILQKADFYNKRVTKDALLQGFDLKKQLSIPAIGASNANQTKDWEVNKYRSDISWIKPRAILPVIKENSGANQIGLAAYSTDVLGSQSYSVEVTGIQSRLWYDITYSNKTFFPGFSLRAYSEPTFSALSFDQDGNGVKEQYGIMFEERGFSLALPFSVSAKDISRPTNFYFSPKFYLEQIRLSDLSPSPLSDFANQYKLGYYAQLNWRILALPRDVQPSSGVVLFSSLENALNNPELQVTFPNGYSQSLILNDRWGHYFGAFGYVSPLRKFNQSLRLDVQFLQQSNQLLYNTNTIVPFGFKNDIFPSSSNIGRFSTRYAIPLLYPDKGSFLVPFHLNAIYITGFSHTISDLDTSSLLTNSRSIFGGGLHFQFSISNLNFELGFGVAYEPSRNQTQFIIGDF